MEYAHTYGSGDGYSLINTVHRVIAYLNYV